jgi:uncharacterized membrane-anchored protein
MADRSGAQSRAGVGDREDDVRSHKGETVTGTKYLNKLPMVTGLFWAIKIVATTLGESVSNYFAITPLHLGYAVSAGIFVVLFAVALTVQMRVDRFRPAVFWSVILATSILGTSVSDFMNRTAGLGYTGGFAVLTTCLVAALVVWRLTGQDMNVERIETVKGEVLYWVATLISNTLGTSSGDFMSNSLGLGFRGSSLVLIVAMLLILVAHYRTAISTTVLFWVAYVLTRPLGAVAENAVEKPRVQGGLGVGTTVTSAVLLALLVVGVLYQTYGSRRGEAGGAAGSAESQPAFASDFAGA